MATTSGDELAIHQYISGTVRTRVAEQDVELELTTNYPADGEVGIRVAAGAGAWTLALRVPAWCEGASVTVNGEAVEAAVDAGRLLLARTWADGDVVTLSLPIPARFSWPDPRIDAVRGQVAVERGPLVHCLESVDFGADVEDAVLDVDAGLTVEDGQVLATLARRTIEEKAWAYASDPAPGVQVSDPRRVPLVPYREWGNRGAGTMRVFVPTA